MMDRAKKDGDNGQTVHARKEEVLRISQTEAKSQNI